MPYPLPNTLNGILDTQGNWATAHPALSLQRLFCWPKEWTTEGEERNREWVRIRQRFQKTYPSQCMRDLLEGVWQRRRETLALLLPEGQRRDYHFLEATVVSRLTIGLGTPTPLETGIALHHTYGTPYVPGSAAKGVARARAVVEAAAALGVERLPPEEFEARQEKRLPSPLRHLEAYLTGHDGKEAEDALGRLRKDNAAKDAQQLHKLSSEEIAERTCRQHFLRVFGSTERQGEVDFLDAFPLELTSKTLTLDVMTPHYSEYYAEGKSPADYLNPTPVGFLVVGCDTRFRFDVVGEDTALRERALGWLKAALEKDGVGAKTRAGYGLMTAHLQSEDLASMAP